jgi:hypothetical protein
MHVTNEFTPSTVNILQEPQLGLASNSNRLLLLLLLQHVRHFLRYQLPHLFS